MPVERWRHGDVATWRREKNEGPDAERDRANECYLESDPFHSFSRYTSPFFTAARAIREDRSIAELHLSAPSSPDGVATPLH
jgi:hypothetical protein